MEPTTLFITDPSKQEIIEVSNSITNTVKNSDNPIIVPQSSSIIKEANNIGATTTNLNQETNVVTNNIESTIPKPIVEPTSKTTTESGNIEPISEPTTKASAESNAQPTTKTTTESNVEPSTKTTTESSNIKPNVESTTNKEFKGTINPEENIEKEIIEPSTTLIEKETNKSDAIHVIKPIKDDSKKNTLIIIFSILGCVIVLGGVIGLSIYFKKKSLNVTNNTNNTGNENSGVVNLKH